MTEPRGPKEWSLEPPPKDFFNFLLVDDEEVARKLLRAILTSHGYSMVDEAKNGEEALNALKAKDYHLVLVDKTMPRIDGMEVLRQGKVIRPGCEFIVITGYGSMESAIQAMDLGAFSYLTKPFSDIAMIFKRIEGAIERVQVRNENAVLIDRLRVLFEELGEAEAKLEEIKAQPAGAGTKAPMPSSKVQVAVTRLRRLAAQLERLRSSGKAAEVFRKISRETTDVADLLAGTETVQPL